MNFASHSRPDNNSSPAKEQRKRIQSRFIFRAAFCAMLIPLFCGTILAAQAVPNSQAAADTLPAPDNNSGSSEMTTEELLSLGQKQLAENLWFSAIETFTTCLEKDPKNAQALKGRSRAYSESGNKEKSLADDEQLAALSGTATSARETPAATQSKDGSATQPAPSPQTALTPTELASQLMSKGDFQGAINQFNCALKEKPNQPQLLSDRAGCYLFLAKKQQAKKDIDLAIKLNPKLDTAYARQAQFDNMNKDYTQAIVNAGRSITLNPKQGLAYSVRAITFFEMKQKPQAMKDAETGIANDPSFIAYYVRGQLLRDQKNDKPINDLTKAIEIAPHFIDGYVALAQTYGCRQRWDKALDVMSKCVRENPRNVSAYWNRSELNMLMTRYSDALYDANKIVELEPKLATSYSHRVEYLVALKRQNEAFQDCLRGLAIDPKNATLYSQRGALYMFREQYQDGITDTTKAIALDPKCAQAYVNRGACYAALEKYPQAQADLLKATALKPSDKDAWRNLGSVYAYLSKYPQAIVCYTKSINIDPRFASVYWDRGRTYRMLGKYELASRDLGIARALGYIPR